MAGNQNGVHAQCHILLPGAYITHHALILDSSLWNSRRVMLHTQIKLKARDTNVAVNTLTEFSAWISQWTSRDECYYCYIKIPVNRLWLHTLPFLILLLHPFWQMAHTLPYLSIIQVQKKLRSITVPIVSRISKMLYYNLTFSTLTFLLIPLSFTPHKDAVRSHASIKDTCVSEISFLLFCTV